MLKYLTSEHFILWTKCELCLSLLLYENTYLMSPHSDYTESIVDPTITRQVDGVI